MAEIKNRAELVEVMATYLDVAPINIEMLLQALENDGLAIVPVTPTEEMLNAGDECEAYEGTNPYRAMISASPFQHREG